MANFSHFLSVIEKHKRRMNYLIMGEWCRQCCEKQAKTLTAFTIAKYVRYAVVAHVINEMVAAITKL